MSELMRKVVINANYGAFSLSLECAAACGIDIRPIHHEMGKVYPHDEVARDCATLVNYVEYYGSEKAGGKGAELRVVEIPADVKWYIHENDGYEYVAEQHRTWSYNPYDSKTAFTGRSTKRD